MVDCQANATSSSTEPDAMGDRDSDAVDAETESVVPVVMEEDDDLIIIEERPAPGKITPDLEMECLDEPLAETQLNKEQDQDKAFQDTLLLVKKWSLKKKLETKRGNTTVMGSKGTGQPPVITPLTRPLQPLKSAQSPSVNTGRFISARPMTAVELLNASRPPISVVRQRAQNKGQIIRPSVLQNQTAHYRIINNKSTRTSSPASTTPVSRPLAIAIPRLQQSTAGTTCNGITLPNGQVINMKNFQPLLFDSKTGLLILPNNGTGVPPQPPPNVNSSAIRAMITNQSSSGVRMTSKPLSTTTPAAPATKIRHVSAATKPPIINTSLARTMVTHTPKIIGTSSLNRNFRSYPVAQQRATSTQRTASSLLSRQKPPLLSRPIHSSPRLPQLPPQPPPPRPTLSRAPQPQVETTNTINGTSPDKDTNNNKTYPSLVVGVKPCLGDKITRQVLNAARADLDGRVKTLLLHTASKLTEWLMQQGLLRLEHRCLTHMTSDGEYIKYKLGMYSDGAKQPFSGGYVWITECCPEKQLSVFHGSIFESAVYTPGTIMKLIYHWACQTTAQNVLQWVKVSSYYLKNFYTLLRSSCVAALHEYAPMMGGAKKIVEVGIITLGTALTQVVSSQKPIKVEILGVYDPAAKVIRMKVINAVGNPSVSNAHTRVQQILWPLKHWVHKDSIILIDTSIEKNYLLDLGFKSVIQSKTGAGTSVGSQQTNANVMNYLKLVIPKMFQSTLCVLSKSLIQQFLDELCWREIWGSTSAVTFDNIIHHLVQMTKWEMGETLISRLNKISLNPFAEWSYTKEPEMGIDMLPDSIRGAGTDMPTLESYAAYADVNAYSNITVNSDPNRRKRKEGHAYRGSKPPILFPHDTSPEKVKQKRKAENTEVDYLSQYLFQNLKDTAKLINMYSYYYAEIKVHFDRGATSAFPTNCRCPLCSKAFLTNLEIVRHVASHVNALGRVSSLSVFCEFCLKELYSPLAYTRHYTDIHKQTFVSFPCYICQEHYPNKNALTLHMWESHGRAEMPYKCEICHYRNSRHHEVVEHFNKEHSGSDQILCPICLKILSVRTVTDMKIVVSHIQKHSVKKGKKCGQCVLTFVTDLEFRAHIASGLHDDIPLSANYSSLQSVDEKELLMPRPPKGSRTTLSVPPPSKKAKTFQHNFNVKITKPKLKDPHLAQLDNEVALRIENVKFYIHKGEESNEVYTCGECKRDVLSPHHFTGCFTCSKCKFSSSCEMSMLIHNRNSHPLGQIRKNIASFPTNPKNHSKVKCRCGFFSESINILTKHMITCGKRTGSLMHSDKLNEGSPGPVNEKSMTSEDDEEMPELEIQGGLLSGLGLHRLI